MNYTLILPLSEIQRGLEDMQLSRVAEKTGYSYMTIKALRDGVERNYGVELLADISNYLRARNVEGDV